MSMTIDVYTHIVQSEQSRKEDRQALINDVERIKADQGAIIDLLFKQGKIDTESSDALQILLHVIDTQPDRVLPVIREFAETATKTLKSRTNIDLPRRPPWLVSPKGMRDRSSPGLGCHMVFS
jgi:hypothetical protein